MELEIEDITSMNLDKELATDTSLSKKLVANIRIINTGITASYTVYHNGEVYSHSGYLQKMINKYNEIV